MPQTPAQKAWYEANREEAKARMREYGRVNNCNTAIGSLRDDPSLLDAAAAYLRSKKD